MWKVVQELIVFAVMLFVATQMVLPPLLSLFGVKLDMFFIFKRRSPGKRLEDAERAARAAADEAGRVQSDAAADEAEAARVKNRAAQAAARMYRSDGPTEQKPEQKPEQGDGKQK